MKIKEITFSSFKLRRIFFAATGFMVFSAFFMSISSLHALALDQEEESVDIDSLKAQLESSRSSLEKLDGAVVPLDNTQNDLEQEEAALMKKLQNVVPSNPSSESKIIKDSETLPLEELSQDKGKAAVTDKNKLLITNDWSKNKKSDEQALESELLVSDKKSPVTKVEVVSPEAAKLAASDKTNADLRKRNSELFARSSDLQSKFNQKSKELEETRNRLVIAETQVERLSGILEKMNSKKLVGYLNPGSAETSAPSNISAHSEEAPIVNQVSHTDSKEESLVGIVAAQKAFLRSGPSKDDSPLMSVSKGTRLVVETRNNEWYRVITPTGGRAWISTEMLSFGPGAEVGSNSALRIGGYEKITR